MNMNCDEILNIAKMPINVEVVSCLKKNTMLFIVGGFLRDFILGKTSYDIDYIVLGESAVELAKRVSKKLDATFVLLDKEHDIARVVLQDKLYYLDFAGCFGKNIIDDINRRDLTINAMVVEISPEIKIVDPLNSCDDIENKKVKIISEKNITDDPLRILRIFRFASQLDFEPTVESLEIARKHAHMLKKIAKERINQELIKFFEGDRVVENLNKMRECVVLYEIFPDMKLEEKVTKNLHHHLTLIEHSIETVNQVNKILKEMPEWLQSRLNSEMANGIKYRSLLNIACFLHDIGKPHTWTIDEEGRHRFMKHDDVGAQIATGLLKDLKFGKNQIKYITKLVKYHIYPSQLLRQEGGMTEKSMNKMFRKLGEETPDIIMLAMSDRLSARGPDITDEIVNRNLSGLKELLNKYEISLEKAEQSPVLLNGHEIIEILNISPCPLVGKILNELKEAQLDGEIITKEQAVEFVKSKG